MNQKLILHKIEDRLPNYERMEELIIKNIRTSYFPLIYQSLYNQLGYKRSSDKKFTDDQFKKLLIENNFVALVIDVYRTHTSYKGLENINKCILGIGSFDKYECILKKFEKLDRRKRRGEEVEIEVNAFSLGTKLLHFYNPEVNPILDANVRNNLKLGEMSLELCLEFKEATNSFVRDHPKYFNQFYNSSLIWRELDKRKMTNKFPKMEILDMALYDKL